MYEYVFIKNTVCHRLVGLQNEQTQNRSSEKKTAYNEWIQIIGGDSARYGKRAWWNQHGST